MTTTYSLRTYRPTAIGQLGMSMVELMISLVIGLILLLGITTLIVQQNSARIELDKSSQQIENGRYATQLLHDDVEHAGFYGTFFSFASLPTVVPDPCATAIGTLRTDMPIAIQGYDVAPTSTAGSPISTCLPNANYRTGTDILVIRRASTATYTTATIASNPPGEVYLQSTPQGVVLDTGANSGNFTLRNNTTGNVTPAPLRDYLVHIYFISPCSVPAGGSSTCTCTQSGGNCVGADDNGRPIPTLKMLELSANGTSTVLTQRPLVEGIENMQIDYGQDTDNDGYPDSFTTTPASVSDWSNVMAVRVNLLARSNECSADYSDNKTYNLGNAGNVSPPASTCTNGDYKRHVFTELIRAVNPSGRRAQQ